MINADNLMKAIDESGDALGEIMRSARKRADKMRINFNAQGVKAATKLYFQAGKIAQLRLRVKIKEVDDSDEMKIAINSFKKINVDLKSESVKIKKLNKKINKARKLLESLEKLLKMAAKMAV